MWIVAQLNSVFFGTTVVNSKLLTDRQTEEGWLGIRLSQALTLGLGSG